VLRIVILSASELRLNVADLLACRRFAADDAANHRLDFGLFGRTLLMIGRTRRGNDEPSLEEFAGGRA
jgi:hypothetical protein